jgi:hypothetical protein
MPGYTGTPEDKEKRAALEKELGIEQECRNWREIVFPTLLPGVIVPALVVSKAPYHDSR